MIEWGYKPTDLFTVPATARVCTVNCVGVMGKGVALEFKQRYPWFFNHYQRRCEKGQVIPGHCYYFYHMDDGVQHRFIAMATKDHWRNPSTYQGVEQGIVSLESVAVSCFYSGDTIIMPLPGCGNGGLAREEVAKLLERHLARSPIKFLICGEAP